MASLDQPVRAAQLDARASGLAENFLRGALFLTILISPLVYIEPSPYEGMIAVLALTCIAAGIKLDRGFLPFIVLLALWGIGGLFALIPFTHEEAAVRFVATSIYLMITGVLYAAIVQDRIMERLSVIRIAYILAALFVATIGIAAYFKVIPNAELFMLYERAKGTFKDPNVFGPYLILPILFLVGSIIERGFRLRFLLPVAWLAFALLLSFSRGAWVHFGVSALAMLALLFLTAPSMRERMHVLSIGIFSAAMLTVLFLVAISFSAIASMFEIRARLVQSYDTGDAGRFTGHLESIPLLLDRPNGFGPLQYIKYIGIDAHQVYIHGFASYGWLGGLAYFALILATLVIGFRAVTMRTAWQPYLIPIYATFIGVVVEGFVIDTNHWRHFHLLLGLIWGLSIASMNLARRQEPQRASPADPASSNGFAPVHAASPVRLQPNAHFRIRLPSQDGGHAR